MKMPPIGKNIKAIRKAANLTQAELANETGYSRSYIGSLESEGDTPSLNVLWKIAVVLSTPLKNFFEEETPFTIETPLTLNEKEEHLLNSYRKLDECNRQTIDKMIMFLTSPQNAVGNVNIQHNTKNSKIFSGNNNSHIKL